jgi:hypothetical protein
MTILFGAFILNIEISTNRLTSISQKFGTHPLIIVDGDGVVREWRCRLAVLMSSST